jgi:hypothetical protein
MGDGVADVGEHIGEVAARVSRASGDLDAEAGEVAAQLHVDRAARPRGEHLEGLHVVEDAELAAGCLLPKAYER